MVVGIRVYLPGLQIKMRRFVELALGLYNIDSHIVKHAVLIAQYRRHRWIKQNLPSPYCCLSVMQKSLSQSPGADGGYYVSFRI